MPQVRFYDIVICAGQCNQIDSGCISPFLSICTPVGWIRRIIFWWSLISFFSIFTCRYRQIDSIIHGRQACSICPFCELDQLDPPVEYVDKYRQWLREERYKENCLEKALPLNFEKMNYEDFLAERWVLMAQKVREAYIELSKWLPLPFPCFFISEHIVLSSPTTARSSISFHYWYTDFRIGAKTHFSHGSRSKHKLIFRPWKTDTTLSKWRHDTVWMTGL